MFNLSGFKLSVILKTSCLTHVIKNTIRKRPSLSTLCGRQSFLTMIFAVLLFICNLSLCVDRAASDTYTVDDSSGLGRRFDGIGGLSGGGVGHGTHNDLYANNVESWFYRSSWLIIFFLSYIFKFHGQFVDLIYDHTY